MNTTIVTIPMEDLIAAETSWQFSAYQSIKRAFDIVFSLFVLMAFGWLFLLIALAIKVDDSRNASITREGTANSVLSLEIGRKHFCQYGTPYGNLQIGVYTHAIENTLAENGRLYLKYTLDLNSSYLSDNEIIMTVQAQN